MERRIWRMLGRYMKESTGMRIEKCERCIPVQNEKQILGKFSNGPISFFTLNQGLVHGMFIQCHPDCCMQCPFIQGFYKIPEWL